MNIVQEVIQSFLSFSSDAVIIAGIAVLFTAYGIFFGKGKLISLILAFYPATYLYKIFPYAKKITSIVPAGGSEAIAQLVIFLALFLPIAYILSTFIFAEFSFSRIKKVISSAALGVTATSLTLLFSYHVINLQKIYNLSAGVDKLFLGSNVFWFLLAPFVIIFFFRK